MCMYIYVSIFLGHSRILALSESLKARLETCTFNKLPVCLRSNISFATHCPRSLRAEGNGEGRAGVTESSLVGRSRGITKVSLKPPVGSLAEQLCGGC